LLQTTDKKKDDERDDVSTGDIVGTKNRRESATESRTGSDEQDDVDGRHRGDTVDYLARHAVPYPVVE
jgi:hypothetical protein